MRRKLPENIQVPEDIETLKELYLIAIKRLYECEDINFDIKGHPYWSSCGEFLDGVKRFEYEE